MTTSAQRKAPLGMCKRRLRKIERRHVAGDNGKQNVFEVVLTVSRLMFVVTFFCAILRPLSLGYLFRNLRKYPKVDFCFLKSTFSYFSYCKGG